MSRRNPSPPPTVVDLFCGCGGFSLGAELAGFRSLAAIDIDATLQSAHHLNFPLSRTIQASVADIDRAAWKQLIGDVRPDALVGGPPCQGFSRIGKRKKTDPRNTLIYQFYRHVDVLRPKIFVMENVEGLLDEENVGLLEDALEAVPSRYKTLKPFVVNAADFGAATSRRRVIVVGYDPADVDRITVEHLVSRKLDKPNTVRDAISDLPAPIADPRDWETFAWTKYPAKAKARLSDYARQLRASPPSGLGWKESVRRHAEGYLSGLVATRHSGRISRRYAVIEGGKSDPITKSFRLEWDGQCPTIRAGTGSDKGSFQAVRPLHPGKGRVITVREAARLQGFPDWFVFHPTKWHSFRMIGNSISPFVSKTILSRIGVKLHARLAA